MLIADANYSCSTNVNPQAALIHLNLRPGLVTVAQVPEPVIATIPIEAVTVMHPDDGSRPEVFAEYEDMLGPDLPGPPSRPEVCHPSSEYMPP